MIDLKRHEYEENEYQEFLSYVKHTFGDLLFDGDFVEEVTIKKIIVHNYKNTFEVFVYINEDASYYDIEDGELIEVAYDGKPIKTTYTLNSQEVLYLLIKGSLIEDLGLSDVEFYILDFIDGIDFNKDLSKRLDDSEGSWAEARYCAIHDL